jgi:hypothetical protein
MIRAYKPCGLSDHAIWQAFIIKHFMEYTQEQAERLYNKINSWGDNTYPGLHVVYISDLGSAQYNIYRCYTGEGHCFDIIQNDLFTNENYIKEEGTLPFTFIQEGTQQQGFKKFASIEQAYELVLKSMQEYK